VKDANGDWTDKPNYIDWVLFGARAEKLAGFLTKGTKVALFGSLSYSSWEDKQGNKRSKLEVIVRELEFFRPSNVVMDAPTAVGAGYQARQQQRGGYQQQMDGYYQQ
jgi:single-strand DNA-binding protein